MEDLVYGQNCPRCHQESVAYNGNYFCIRCPWAMGDSNQPKRIVKAYLSQRWIQAERAGDLEEMDRIGEYLVEYLDAS